MTKQKKGVSRTAQAWWLIETGDTCSACGHQYARGTEIYCDGCDGSVCAICVQRTVGFELVCPGCFDGAGTEVERDS